MFNELMMNANLFREVTLPDGRMGYGRPVEFELIKEAWAEYALSDGHTLRVRAAVQRVYRVVDESGHDVTDAEGEPLYAVEGSTAEQRRWFALHPLRGELVEIDPEQAWFWSAEWQAKEREADTDLRESRYETFDNFDDFIDSL